MLIFHAFSFAVYENDLDRCIFNILGVPRVVPKDFCNAIPQFGVKIRPREVNNFIILEGEPGCGKTTLAKSFAQATDSYCIVVRCGEMSRSGVKGSASDEVARMFEIAEKHMKDAELLECYIKCVQDLSKEQCKHIAQVLLSRGIRSEF